MSFKTNGARRTNPINNSRWDQKHQQPKGEDRHIQHYNSNRMQFDGNCREVIGLWVKMDKARGLLNQAEAHTYDISYEHAQKQDADGPAEEHLSNKAIVGAHGLQKADGRGLLDDDDQQHGDYCDASNKEH